MSVVLQQNRFVPTITQVSEVYNNTGYGLVLLCKVLVISARGDNNLSRNQCSRVFPPLALDQKWPSKFALGNIRSVPRLPTTLSLVLCPYYSTYLRSNLVSFAIQKSPPIFYIPKIVIKYLYFKFNFYYEFSGYSSLIQLTFRQLNKSWWVCETACSLDYIRVTQMVFVLSQYIYPNFYNSGITK